jgi:acid phosphatase type 7
MVASTGTGGRRFGRPRLRAADPPLSATAGAQPFAPLPSPPGPPPYRMTLASVIGDEAASAITRAGGLDFHIMGDTGGIKNPLPQENVASALELDIPSAPAAGTFDPSFLYLLGDCIYFSGAEASYYDQFYEPYTHYLPPIFAIPGNHDGGGVPIPPGQTTLDGFVQNFCTPTPVLNAAAHGSQRHTMTQPNFFWTLQAPFVTIIGLYTNISEIDGQLDSDQIAWLDQELTAAPTDQALIVTMHHPSISADDHYGGSNTMYALLDAAMQRTGRVPTMVLAGHVHNYQRFSRNVTAAGGSRTIPYIVVGNGGYLNLHRAASDAKSAKLPFAMANYQGVLLEALDDGHYGYGRIRVNASELSFEYVAVSVPPGAPLDQLQPALKDQVTVDLSTGSVTPLQGAQARPAKRPTKKRSSPQKR